MIRKSRLYFLSSPGIEPERGLFVLSSEEAVYDTGIEFFLGGHFEVRELRLLEGPFEEGQTVRIRGSATCRAEGVPDFELVLEEIVTSEGERIIHLEDRYDDGAKEALRAYLDEHRETLAFAITS